MYKKSNGYVDNRQNIFYIKAYSRYSQISKYARKPGFHANGDPLPEHQSGARILIIQAN